MIFINFLYNNLYKLEKNSGSKIVRHPTPRNTINNNSSKIKPEKRSSGTNIITPKSRSLHISINDNRDGPSPRSKRLSKNLTKQMFHTAGLYQYDDLVEDNELFHNVFLKIDRKELNKIGITDKNDQDRILETCKEYNHALPKKISDLKKTRELLLSSTPASMTPTHLSLSSSLSSDSAPSLYASSVSTDIICTSPRH